MKEEINLICSLFETKSVNYIKYINKLNKQLVLRDINISNHTET